MTQNDIDPKNREQQQAFELIAHTNSSLFLTGRAGTGKTTFLRKVQQLTGKQFITLAPTGVAAVLAGGQTIHSFFGLPTSVCDFGTIGSMNYNKIMALRHADTIIIDEVSMVRCDLLDAVDRTMRAALMSHQPFGGKQMVFVGDVFQLSPVVNDEDAPVLKELYNKENFFFFNSNAYEQLRPVRIEFLKMYRQDDPMFLALLEKVRLNTATQADIDMLNKRVATPDDDRPIITLATVNDVVRKRNKVRLAEIDSEERVYTGIVSGDFKTDNFIVEEELHLKVGAQVMFLRNDPARRWVNGTIGTVAKLDDNDIQVTLSSGETCSVQQCTWQSYKNEFNRETRKVEKNETGSFTQYPLKLAWAITIHKSQGSTFERVVLDLQRQIFASGQLYVALSRLRSLDGLYLSRPLSLREVSTDPAVLDFAKGFNDTCAVEDEIEQGKAVYEALKRNDIDEAAKQYLLMTAKKAETDVVGALWLAKRFLDTVICDDHLYGCIDEVPATLFTSQRWVAQYLVALLSLYANKPQQALDYIDRVLMSHNCNEALYIRERALEHLGRIKEADAVCDQLGETLDGDSLDVKILYLGGMINERHLGISGVSMLNDVLKYRPNYDRAVVAMREALRKRGVMLETSLNSDVEGEDKVDEIEGGESSLVNDFNDASISDDEFLAMLRQSSKDAVDNLVNSIESIDIKSLE